MLKVIEVSLGLKKPNPSPLCGWGEKAEAVAVLSLIKKPLCTYYQNSDWLHILLFAEVSRMQRGTMPLLTRTNTSLPPKVLFTLQDAFWYFYFQRRMQRIKGLLSCCQGASTWDQEWHSCVRMSIISILKFPYCWWQRDQDACLSVWERNSFTSTNKLNFSSRLKEADKVPLNGLFL